MLHQGTCWRVLTGNDKLLVGSATECFLGDQVEPFHRILHHLLIPLLVQAQLINKELLKDAIQERAPTQSPGPHGCFPNSQNRFQFRHSIGDQIHRTTSSVAQHECITNLNAVRVHRVQSVDGGSFGFGNDLQVLAHPRRSGTCAGLGLGRIGPYCRNGNDVLNRRALDDA